MRGLWVLPILVDTHCCPQRVVVGQKKGEKRATKSMDIPRCVTAGLKEIPKTCYSILDIRAADQLVLFRVLPPYVR